MIHIIYIDDEADSDAMRSKFEVMQDFGLEVSAVTTVEHALQEIRRGGPASAVVLDRIMPPGETYTLDETNGGTSTGIRLLEDIRREFPLLAIFVVSVMPSSDEKELVSRFGIKGYITKPADGEKLAAVILRALGVETELA
jgi:CheY-like chemotaxis protein